MKKIVLSLAVLTILAGGAIAYAHGPGGWGFGGPMMGPGYGGHMMGAMMGTYGTGTRGDQKFFDETASLRKQLHEKRFDYFEASRDPKTPPGVIEKLEKDIFELQSKIREKAPKVAYGYGAQGHCW
jgi:hypothetical protein